MGDKEPGMNIVPGDVFIAHVQENEEALVVGRVGFVRLVHGSHLLHREQVNHVDVDLLRDGGRIEGVLNFVTFRPCSAVHV